MKCIGIAKTGNNCRYDAETGSDVCKYHLTQSKLRPVPVCSSIAKSTGERCRNPAISGLDTCQCHSGKKEPEIKVPILNEEKVLPPPYSESEKRSEKIETKMLNVMLNDIKTLYESKNISEIKDKYLPLIKMFGDESEEITLMLIHSKIKKVLNV